MDSHNGQKHTDAGSVARMMARLRAIFAKLSPERREAMRKWCDAQENEEANDHPGGVA